MCALSFGVSFSVLEPKGGVVSSLRLGSWDYLIEVPFVRYVKIASRDET
jgi:hypothetical protein